MRITVAVLVCLSLLACEGPTGPEGPQGESGPGTRVTHSGMLDSNGEALVPLLQDAGDATDPPSISCYVSSDGDVWTQIALDTSGDSAIWLCGWTEQDDGRLAVVISMAGAGGWEYQVTVVY